MKIYSTVIISSHNSATQKLLGDSAKNAPPFSIHTSAKAQLVNDSNNEKETYLRDTTSINPGERIDAKLASLLNIEAPIPAAFTFELRTPPGSPTEYFDHNFVSKSRAVQTQTNQDAILNKTFSTLKSFLLNPLAGESQSDFNHQDTNDPHDKPRNKVATNNNKIDDTCSNMD